PVSWWEMADFTKRPEKDVPNVLPKDKRSFKNKIPPSIHENPLYQRLGRHPVNVRTFPDLILFIAGLKSSWEHEMAFRNFMYAEDDEDLSFLPRESSLRFGTSSPFDLINNKPPLLKADPLDSANPEQLVENTANSGGSPAHEKMLVIGTGSIAGRMKDRKCMTKGSTKPPVKHKLVHDGSSLRSTRQKSSPAKAEYS
ncbi:hypothetical protein Tco_0056394, partial [Tanacetum coccineum]